MKIVVTDRAGELDTFDAQKWVIDDDERLHIVGTKGNLASYNRGAWASVHRGDDSSPRQAKLILDTPTGGTREVGTIQIDNPMSAAELAHYGTQIVAKLEKIMAKAPR